MKSLTEAFKTSVIGGLVVLLPIWLVAITLKKIIGAANAVAGPLAERLAGSTHLAGPILLVLVVVACFLTGLVIRTTMGRWFVRTMEKFLLERVPGYTLFRSVTRRFAGEGEDVMFAPAMAVFDNALVPAFVVEKHDDGRYTIFVPSAPTPAAGAIHILPASRVHLLDVPLSKAVKCITSWGAGSRELLAAMRTT
jgi:uncharacterized membrane protein